MCKGTHVHMCMGAHPHNTSMHAWCPLTKAACHQMATTATVSLHFPSESGAISYQCLSKSVFSSRNVLRSVKVNFNKNVVQQNRTDGLENNF